MLSRIPKSLAWPAGFFGGELLRHLYQQFLASTLPQDKAMAWLNAAIEWIPPWLLAGIGIGMFILIAWNNYRQHYPKWNDAARLTLVFGQQPNDAWASRQENVLHYIYKLRIPAEVGHPFRFEAGH
jgi:hypothetical protein